MFIEDMWRRVCIECLGNEDKNKKEEEENSKHLDHKPTVGGDVLEVLGQLALGTLHMYKGVFYIGADSASETGPAPFNGFTLLSHHGCDIAEDALQLTHRALDRLDGGEAGLCIVALLRHELLWDANCHLRVPAVRRVPY